jgi:hypothetical protein
MSPTTQMYEGIDPPVYFDGATVQKLARAYDALFDVLTSLKTEKDCASAALRKGIDETLPRVGACLAMAAGMRVRQADSPVSSESVLGSPSAHETTAVKPC